MFLLDGGGWVYIRGRPSREWRIVLPRKLKSSAAAPAHPLPAAAAAASGELVAVRVNGVRCEQSRVAGPVHVGYQFWRRLELDSILEKAGLSEGARRLTLN